MMDFLNKLSDIQLFFFLNFALITASLLGMVLVQCFVPNELRKKHNAVVGNVSALLGLIYGVLAGITALWLINNLSYTSDAVQREANAVSNLYRDSQWLKPPAKDYVKEQIVDYLHRVIDVEWPMMKDGKHIDVNAGFNIDKISLKLDTYSSFSNSEMLILHDMLDEIKALYDAREERIEASYESLNSDLWAVLLISTALIIGVNFLFGMNFYMHLTMTAVSAIMASAIIFLLLTLDKPFQGDFVINPDGFQELLDNINHPPQMTAPPTK
jgi:hypothetical protein